MQETLEVAVRQQDAVVILTTKGYINNIGAEKISDSCNALLNQNARNFILNLENSRVINSIGISILIEVIEKVKAHEGKVAFCQVTPTIAKTFRIMGLLQSASVHDTEGEAIAALS